MVEKQYSNKSWATTLFLAFFLGYLGVHRFYAGKIGSGIIYLLTIGCFGIGWFIDIILIAAEKFTDKNYNIIGLNHTADYKVNCTVNYNVDYNDDYYVTDYSDDFDDNIDIEIETIDSTNVSSIDGMDGHEFEHFCAELLRKNGFSNVNVTPGSGDQGVDILAEKGGVKYAIQCKNYASALSNTPVQEVSAGKMFYNCHVGVVLTNSTFTSGAKKLAEATGVLLWDRTELQNMMDNANMGQPSVKHASYKNYSDSVEEILTEIQGLINLSTDTIDPLAEALDRFANAIEPVSSLFDSTPIDTELLCFGLSVKIWGDHIYSANEQIMTKSLKIFDSLAKHGFDGWSTEQSFFNAISTVHKDQQKITKMITSTKDTIANMENQYGIRNKDFQKAKQQALSDIEQGIAAARKANACLEDVLGERKKFKK
jgi:restriction system protein